MCMSCQLQQLLQTSNRFIHKTMSIGIGDNFNYQGSKFNMDRDSFQTKEAMKNYPETSLPPKGFRTYCAEDDEYYEFNAENSVDPDTGKWRMVDNPTAKKTVEDAKTNGDYAKEQGDAAKEAARKVTNDVLFKVFQSLTEEEQTQVKQNIGIGVEQKFQGQFESYSELEGVSSPAVGDYAYVGNPRNLYAYKSSGWVNLGEFNYNIDQELDAESERGIANGVVTKGIASIEGKIGFNEYPTFSEEEPYQAGNVVNYNGKLYQFIADHAVGAFDEGQVSDYSMNKMLINDSIVIAGYHRSGGTFVNDENFFYLKISIQYGQKIIFFNTIESGDTVVVNSFIDKNGNPLSKYNAVDTSFKEAIYTAPENSAFLILNGKYKFKNLFYYNVLTANTDKLNNVVKLVDDIEGYVPNKYYVTSSNSLIEKDDTAFYTFIKRCNEGQKITFYNTISSGSRTPRYAFLALDKTTLIKTGVLYYTAKQLTTLIVPTGASYFLFSGEYSDIQSYYFNIEDDFGTDIKNLNSSISNIYQQLGQLGGNPLKDKIIYNTGDSIAYGAGNNGNGYAGIIANNYGATLVQRAVSGATIRKVDDRACIPDYIVSAETSSKNKINTSDFIFIEGGINDVYGHKSNVPSDKTWLGEFNPDTSLYANEEGISNIPNTFYDMLDFCLGYISRKAKSTAKIIYVIQWKCGNANKLVEAGDTDSYSRWISIYNAIYMVCKKHGIAIVDLWKDCRANAAIEPYIQYTNNEDKVHPTQEGYELFFVNPIIAKLSSI